MKTETQTTEDVTINVIIPKPWKDLLEQLAEDRDQSVSAVVRTILKRALVEKEKK
jgi:hypothetical protein